MHTQWQPWSCRSCSCHSTIITQKSSELNLISLGRSWSADVTKTAIFSMTWSVEILHFILFFQFFWMKRERVVAKSKLPWQRLVAVMMVGMRLVVLSLTWWGHLQEILKYFMAKTSRFPADFPNYTNPLINNIWRFPENGGTPKSSWYLVQSQTDL